MRREREGGHGRETWVKRKGGGEGEGRGRGTHSGWLRGEGRGGGGALTVAERRGLRKAILLKPHIAEISANRRFSYLHEEAYACTCTHMCAHMCVISLSSIWKTKGWPFSLIVWQMVIIPHICIQFTSTSFPLHIAVVLLCIPQ